MSLVNTRFDRVMTFMNQTDQLTHSIIKAVQDSSNKHSVLEQIILEETEKVSELRNRLTRIIVGTNMLAHQKIPSFFVPPKEMKNTLNEIAMKLQNELSSL